MKESGKKAYEIAYALWRIAAHSSEKAFADILRNKAIELVGFAADENFAGLHSIGDSLEELIKFAVDVNCVSVGNAAILVREIGKMKAAISDIPAKNKFADINIADIFSDGFGNKFTKEEVIEEEEAIPDFADINDEVSAESGKKAEIRQAAILEKIQEIGNCRLADIQAILPNTSERTIRYDLESLVRQNRIERVGSGGRSVYYRPKQSL